MAIYISNLICKYKSSKWQLGPLSLKFDSNKLIGIIGPNGSGKSTLISAIARVQDFSGNILINNKNILSFHNREWASTVAYLPQRIELQFDFSVEQAVAFGRYAKTGLFGFTNHNDNLIIENCLKKVDLFNLRSRPLSKLSGGELQRVHLASVLVQEPQILLLDEPTAALDIHHQIDFYDFIKSCVNSGITVIIVTHELTLAAHYCDELLLISNGQIVIHDTPENVIQEKILHKIYSKKICVHKHPHTGKPVILPEYSSESNPKLDNKITELISN